MTDGNADKVSATVALYEAAVQKYTRTTSVVTAMYTLAFAYAGAVVAALAARPEVFVGARAALLPLPVWSLVLVANVVNVGGQPERSLTRILGERLSKIAGVELNSRFDFTPLRAAWSALQALVAVFAAGAFLIIRTLYCVARAADSGSGLTGWLIIYLVMVVLALPLPLRSSRRADREAPGRLSGAL